MDEILETKTKECETLSRKADSYLEKHPIHNG
jgi:hypothetical protein